MNISNPPALLEKDHLANAILGSEIGEGKKGRQNIYRLSFAAIDGAVSGYSIGRVQIDLGVRETERQELIDKLIEHGVYTENDRPHLNAILSNAKSRTLIMDKKKAGTDGFKIHQFFNSAAGKKLVDQWDDRQLNSLTMAVKKARAAAKKNPRYQSGSKFQKFVNSTLFAIWVADHKNQHGNVSEISEWLSGKAVILVQTKKDPVTKKLIRLKGKQGSIRVPPMSKAGECSIKRFIEFESKIDFTRRTRKLADDLARRSETRSGFHETVP